MCSTRRHLYHIIIYCNIIFLQCLSYHTSRRVRNNGDAFSAVNRTVHNTRVLVREKPLWRVRLVQNIIMRLGQQLSHAVATLNPNGRNGFCKKFEWPNREKKNKKRGKIKRVQTEYLRLQLRPTPDDIRFHCSLLGCKSPIVRWFITTIIYIYIYIHQFIAL